MKRTLFLLLFFVLSATPALFSQTISKFSIPASAVTASTYDTANNAVPANAVDGSFSTRWSGQGDGAFITFDLGPSQTVSYVKIAWHQGDTRTENFEIRVSADGLAFSTVWSGNSSGTTANFETYDFTDAPARYVRIVGHGNSSGNGWNSISELEVWGIVGSSGGGSTGAVPFTVEAQTVGYDSSYWSLVSDAAASGGSALKELVNSTGAAPGAGGLVYTFSLNSAATVYLQIKAKAANTSSDSVWGRLDSGSWSQFTFDSTNQFTWRYKSYSAVAAGTHTFELRCRETNGLVDLVAVTLDNGTPLPPGSSTVAAPTFNPGAGSYTSAQNVAISSATSGATIRYTTDGSTPTASSGTVYSGAVNVASSLTLKAIAYKSGLTDSAVSSASYTITGGAAAKFSVSGGAVVASADDGNVPANTVDGSLATRWSAQGDGQWIRYDLGAVNTASFVKIAWYQGDTRSSTFDVQTSSDGSTWATVHSGTSSGATTALETYDFADTPARYVRVVGHGNSSGNGWNSITETEVWGFSGGANTVATPTFSPPAGSYSSGQSVTLSTTTSGSTIRYTTNGSTPSQTNGTVYSAPVAVNVTTTLKAIAYKSGMTDSAVASGTYTITTNGLDPNAPPGTNFDLSHWKITLPINNAEEHSTAELVAGYEHPDWFFTDPDTGGMVFKAPNIGDTTGGSSYTRSELREMLAPSGPADADNNNWVISTSSSATKSAAGGVDGTMNATLTVDHVSTTGDSGKVGRVIVGQIHTDNRSPDTEVIRLYFHKRPSDTRGAIYFGHDDPSNNNSYIPIIGSPTSLNPANGILLGETWSYEIKVVGRTLTVKVTPQGGSTTTVNYTLESGYDNADLYFKAGVYNQNNTGTTDDYAQATFYSLTHTHP